MMKSNGNHFAAFCQSIWFPVEVPWSCVPKSTLKSRIPPNCMCWLAIVLMGAGSGTLCHRLLLQSLKPSLSSAGLDRQSYENVGPSTPGNAAFGLREPSLKQLFPIIFLIGFLGNGLLVAFRRLFIVDMHLPFPSSTAVGKLQQIHDLLRQA